ncbi:MAG: alpha/beta hydrolase [Treponema sp.]|nr:alpha/beta hydrolase [Treponema sp.]
MPHLNLNYLFSDPDTMDKDALPNYDGLDFVSAGSHIYGEILWPSGEFKKPHPCVIMLHGFPGSARNDDISHALCRIGCVVLVPHHRGAWGSQGKYLVTHCVEDAYNLAVHARSEAFAKKYGVDTNNIFLLGHSMGGNSALNAGKNLPWIQGLILLAPYDPTCLLEKSKEEYLGALLNEGKILNSDGTDAIYQDIQNNWDNLQFTKAYPKIRDKNILIFSALYDSVSINNKMISPLWNLLKEGDKKQQAPVHRLIEYPTEHGLLGRRISMIREIGKFVDECCK